MRVEVSGVVKSWRLRGSSPRPAVDRVSFSIEAGEVLGLVGESGCGKSTLARLLVGAYRPEAGTIRYEGRPLSAYTRQAQAQMVQLIFQDPAATLHPRHDVRWQLAEALRFTLKLEASERDQRIRALLAAVQLPETCLALYPHQLSGGQKQRVAIARALALEPQVLVADEALSALDRITQSEVMALLRSWCDVQKGSLLLISHDLSAVRLICDRIAVMYGGHLLELRRTQDLFRASAHPYARYLLQSVPKLYRDFVQDAVTIRGTQQTAVPQTGCVWAARCHAAAPRCTAESPPLQDLKDGSGAVACHFPLLPQARK